MITTFLLTILYSLLNLLVGFLPIGSLPAPISSALTYFVGILNTFNFFFPIDTLLTVLVFAVGFHAIIYLYHLINWIYHKIRG